MARAKEIQEKFKGDAKAYWYKGNVFLLFSSGHVYLCPDVGGHFKVTGTEEEKLNKVSDIIDVEHTKKLTEYKLAECRNLVKKYKENIQDIEKEITNTEYQIKELEKELNK